MQYLKLLFFLRKLYKRRFVLGGLVGLEAAGRLYFKLRKRRTNHDGSEN